jgi:hypothetical protein
VTRRAALPTSDEVHDAITAITETVGKPPSILALAKHLGLANTTFRRQFPDIAADLSRIRSTEPGHENAQHSSPYQELKQHNGKLRRDIEELTMHLELAVANIQRLTLENHRLRRERDEATHVTPITRARQRRTPR